MGECLVRLHCVDTDGTSRVRRGRPMLSRKFTITLHVELRVLLLFDALNEDYKGFAMWKSGFVLGNKA